MLPPDPYRQFDQSDRSDALDSTDEYPTSAASQAAPPPQLYYPPEPESPLPLPYDDRDPTYQVAPSYQPPTVPAPYPGPARPVQPYVAPPIYLPPVQPQIIYIRERRRSWFSISCSILSILLLMTCGLIGLGVFREVTSAWQLASKTIPSRITLLAFCTDEMNQDYHDAYQQLSSRLQQQVTESAFTQESLSLDQQKGIITACSRSNSSVDTASGDTAKLQVDVTRTTIDDSGTSSSVDYHGSIVFLQEGSNWHIDQIDPALPLPSS